MKGPSHGEPGWRKQQSWPVGSPAANTRPPCLHPSPACKARNVAGSWQEGKPPKIPWKWVFFWCSSERLSHQAPRQALSDVHGSVARRRPPGTRFLLVTLFSPVLCFVYTRASGGEMEIGGELVGLEIGVICMELGQEGQSAGRVC